MVVPEALYMTTLTDTVIRVPQKCLAFGLTQFQSESHFPRVAAGRDQQPFAGVASGQRRDGAARANAQASGFDDAGARLASFAEAEKATTSLVILAESLGQAGLALLAEATAKAFGALAADQHGVVPFGGESLHLDDMGRSGG